jgi:hypothetical protein
MVRAFIACYGDFTLAMDRSLGFGSTLHDSSRTSHSLSLRLRGAHPLTLPCTVTRRLIMQKARRHPRAPKGIGLRPLVGSWFQVLFHSPHGVLFTFPSRYWFTIGRR